MDYLGAGLIRWRDRDQLESLRQCSGFQARQFPFGAPSLEGRGASIDPSFAAGEQAVDQHGQVAGYGLDCRSTGGQLFAQMPVPASQGTSCCFNRVVAAMRNAIATRFCTFLFPSPMIFLR